MELIRPAELARILGISPQRVRQLAAAGRIPSTATPGGHRRFDLAEVRAALEQSSTPTWTRSDPIENLSEDDVWADLRRELGDFVGLPALRILRYAVTEMVNNAIDHSEGTKVVTSLEALRPHVVVTVRDDGIGVFARVRQEFDLPDDFAAVAELTKGKRTSAPERHSGEGIFFTSKATDQFELAANGIRWTVDTSAGDHAVGSSEVSQGTKVRLMIDPATDREIVDVFRAFSDGHAFVRSAPVIRLFEMGTEFVSRSEAKRLVAGMEEFERITLDFAGVDAVGQGFVDELFRVWNSGHPSVVLEPVNMNPAVRFMVERGLAP